MTRLLFFILILSGLNGTGYASTARIKCDSLGDGAETGLNKGIHILKIQTGHHCITKKMAIR